MTRVRFVPAPGATKVLLAELVPAIDAVAGTIAAKIADGARDIPPKSAGGGGYAGSVRAEGPGVGTTHIAGHIIEFGGSHTPAYAPLRTAAEALGLEVRDERG